LQISNFIPFALTASFPFCYFYVYHNPDWCISGKAREKNGKKVIKYKKERRENSLRLWITCPFFHFYILKKRKKKTEKGTPEKNINFIFFIPITFFSEAYTLHSSFLCFSILFEYERIQLYIIPFVIWS
jgi:hypothetical protein